MNARAISKRLWTSGALTSIAATGARSVAFLIPIPFLTTYFDTSIVALWFLIISFQSLTALAIGNLPVILMHMVSHALAKDEEKSTRICDVVRGVSKIFSSAVLLYFALAIFVFTPLLWRQIGMTGEPTTALVTWAIFVIGVAIRVKTLGYTTFLLGLNQVADVRRMEAATWMAGGIASAAGLYIWPDLIFAMALLQAPALVYLLAMRRLAIRHNWSDLLARNSDEAINIWPEVLPRAIRGSVGIVTAYLTVYGSSIIFAQFGDSASIAAFSFTVTLFGLISQLAVGHTWAALPLMARAYASNQFDTLSAIASRANWIGLAIYLLLAGAVWAGYLAVAYVAPNAFPAIDLNLYILFFIAYLPVRYASFHLHFYTITNDIRWHIYQSGVGTVFFVMIFVLGPASTATYPIALFVANVLFAIPYSRYLTWKKLGFGLDNDKWGTVIFVLATAIAGSFLVLNSQA